MLLVDNIVHIFKIYNLDVYDLYNFLITSREYYDYINDREIHQLVKITAKRYLIKEYGYIFMTTNKIDCDSLISRYEHLGDVWNHLYGEIA
jgi:hypothetical protein